MDELFPSSPFFPKKLDDDVQQLSRFSLLSSKERKRSFFFFFLRAMREGDRFIALGIGDGAPLFFLYPDDGSALFFFHRDRHGADAPLALRLVSSPNTLPDTEMKQANLSFFFFPFPFSRKGAKDRSFNMATV